MSRYIDADELKANCDIMVGNTTIGRRDYVMFHEIDSAPSIDIVRCKECKHRYVEEQSWGEYNEFCDFWCDGNGYWASVNADDFCSYGCNSSEKPNNFATDIYVRSKERSSE